MLQRPEAWGSHGASQNLQRPPGKCGAINLKGKERAAGNTHRAMAAPAAQRRRREPDPGSLSLDAGDAPAAAAPYMVGGWQVSEAGGSRPDKGTALGGTGGKPTPCSPAALHSSGSPETTHLGRDWDQDEGHTTPDTHTERLVLCSIPLFLRRLVHPAPDS